MDTGVYLIENVANGRRYVGSASGWTDERRRKISESNKGRVITQDQRDRISATLMGHKQSAEQIEKRRLKLIGRKMPEGFAEATRQRLLGSKLGAAHCENIGRSKAKLTDDQVREIRRRRAVGESRKALALEYSVDAASVTHIVNLKSYRWVI